jgi:uncharacterized protein (TIGR00251 family)
VQINEIEGGLEFSVRVVPRASRTEIAGEIGGAVKVRVASPPVDGAANKELVGFLAKRFGVSRSDVHVVAGTASRNKTVRVRGITARQLQDVLGP